MKNTVDVDMGDVMRGVTVSVRLRGVRGYRVRFWIGSMLVRLAAWVLRCGVAIEGRDA